LEAEAAGDGGAAVLEVVEAGGDAGGIDGPIGLERRVAVGEGRAGRGAWRAAGRGPGGSTRSAVRAGGH
jgi:hypothetical protein